MYSQSILKRATITRSAVLGLALVFSLSGCGGSSGTTCSAYLQMDEVSKVAAIVAADPDTYQAYGDAKDTFARTMVPEFDEFCSDPSNAEWDIADTIPSIQ